MSDTQSSFPSLRPVNLESVESELDNMWREANARTAMAGGQAYSRNSVLTLVAFTPSIQRAHQVINLVHSMTTTHPSRAIVIAADPSDSGDSITSSIGTYVGADAASYGEDILVVAQTNAIRHLPGVVLPMIVSGLPAFLRWTDEPPWGTDLLEALVDGSDRFIVDTSEMSDVPRSFTALADLVRRKKSRCAVSDVSWSYQSPWREIVAQFFDPAPLRPYLDAIERVTIEYAVRDEDAPLNTGQAYLFAGWLTSRLGWRVERTPHDRGSESQQFTLRTGSERPIMMEINARFGVPEGSWGEMDSDETAQEPPADNEPEHAHNVPWIRHGALMSVHLSSRLSGPRATFTVARESDLTHATTLCQVPDGAAPPPQTVHLQSIGEQAPLAGQLQILGHDLVYEEALAAAAQFIGTARKGVV
ncbi:MAG TPA: glucose-6-phosphate dehydrogenase assembly protein OpcA [Ktedonobacterales bacterium]|nr:glucose-6-phosphate dehydrogenase assembly protein OpcA [Ktedonobacterales bacterium]